METLANSHILIALNLEDNRERIESIFKQHRCEPIFVETKEDILDSLDIVKFDLFLVTLSSPDSERFETIQKIRAAEKSMNSTRLTILGLVTSSSRINELSMLKSGVDQYITSPYTDELLVQIVVRLITNPISKKNDASMLDSSHLPILNKEDFLDRIGDEETFFKVATVVLSLMPEWLDKMRANILEKNEEMLRQNAHSARGAFADLGAQRAAYVLACTENAINEHTFGNWEHTQKAIDLIFQDTQLHIERMLSEKNINNQSDS